MNDLLLVLLLLFVTTIIIFVVIFSMIIGNAYRTIYRMLKMDIGKPEAD